MNNNLFKNLVTISLIIFIISCSFNQVENNDITINNMSNGYCTTYCLGNVFIGDRNFLSSVDASNYWDICVVDLRNGKKDPDMIVCDSFKISDPIIQKEIIEILCDYEEKYPSDWERSEDTMMLEWAVHNSFYYLFVLRERTGSVDFNNKDEELYNNKILKKVLL